MTDAAAAASQTVHVAQSYQKLLNWEMLCTIVHNGVQQCQINGPFHLQS